MAGKSWKVDQNTGELVPMEQWNNRQRGEVKQQDQQQRIKAIQAMQTQSQPLDTYSPADLMPPTSARPINPNYAQSHKVTEKIDAESKERAFLKSFMYGLIPLYTLLSFGIVFFVTGTLYISISIIIMAALSSATWLGYKWMSFSHSVDGVERLRINADSKTQRHAISESAEIAKLKIQSEIELRREQLRIQQAMLTGNMEVLNRE